MLILVVRTLILYGMVIAAMRIMGKRQLGELQPSELVVAIMISDLASVPMQAIDIPLLSGIIPVLTLIVAEVMMSYLRLNGCHDISDVAVAVLETSGKLSVIPKDKARPVTVEDLQLENVRHDGLPCVIVSDGTLNEGVLTRAKKDHIWLTKELKKRNIKDVKEIFVASLDAEDELFIQLKGEWRK